MKKIFFYVLGLMTMLCSCESSSQIEEDGNKMTASGYVEGFGDATLSVSHYNLRAEDPECEIYGFSGAEDFGRWTNDDTCIVIINDIVSNSDLTAKFKVEMTAPGGEPVKYDAFANGVYVGSGQSLSQSIYINIPSEVVADNDNLALLLVMSNLKRPIDLNPSVNDTRRLGLAVSGITLYGVSQDEEDTDEE